MTICQGKGHDFGENATETVSGINYFPHGFIEVIAGANGKWRFPVQQLVRELPVISLQDVNKVKIDLLVELTSDFMERAALCSKVEFQTEGLPDVAFALGKAAHNELAW